MTSVLKGSNPIRTLVMVRQKGLEPLAYCLEGSCSIQLSYWRIKLLTSSVSLYIIPILR